MKRKIFSIISLILLLVLTLSLTGCGTSKTTAPVEEDAVEIKLWARSFEDYADNLLMKQVAEFNKDLTDGVQVSLHFYGDDNTYDTAIAAGQENGTVAEVYMAQYDRIITYHKAGYILPIGDYLSDEIKAGYIESIKEDVTYKDPADGEWKMYAMPWYVEPSMMLYYDKAKLREAGVTEIPTTQTGLLEMCAKVSKVMKANLNQYTLIVPTTSVELTWTTFGLLENFTGGQVVDESWKNSRLDMAEAQFKECASLFYELSKNNYSPIASLTPEGYVDGIDAVCDGKAAMALCGSWGIGRIMNYYPEIADNIGIAAMPGRYNTTGTSCNGGWTYVVSSKCSEEKAQAAAKFLTWYLCKVENACQTFEASFYAKGPTRTDVKEYLNTHAKGVNPDWVALVNEVSSQGVMPPGTSWSVSVQMGSLFEYMLNHAKEGKNFDTLYREKIVEVKDTIESITSQSGYVTNPKLK